MALSKRYLPDEMEPRLRAWWQETGVYNFSEDAGAPLYTIDTPPATVSGLLHLGHVYSYSHVDFMARFFRMNGYNVFYPMGFDDNGLPTDRYVEKRLGIKAVQVGRQAFIEKCLEVSEEAEKDYRELWQRLGLSIDWRHTYRTIDELSRRTAQVSFLDLYRKGLAYRSKAPVIWCPECRTAIAQAELNDLDRESEFVTLPFLLEDGETLPIATTRPELLSACVAVFVHPEDSRYRGLVNRQVVVPLYGQRVPILVDAGADPQKGTGVVMCCTFGDQADVTWWKTHHLPLVEAIDRQGCMTAVCGELAGMSILEARKRMKHILTEQGLILGSEGMVQSVRVHERCDTLVEHIITPQWFVRILDFKDEFLAIGDQIKWHPEHMLARYRAWVENLNWDWCISRQRYFGVPFPVWYCDQCGEVILAEDDQLPVDPLVAKPSHACSCGSVDFTPETDVMDTWATSSLTPQIVAKWLVDPDFYSRLFPMSLRAQAHEIIRTWAFYTIVKSHFHFSVLPWKEVLISGWALAGEGMGKISKSRGGGPMSPLEMINRYSADAVRYWAASTSPGKDTIISEEKIQMGAKLVTKLWNVARFGEPFLTGYVPPVDRPDLNPTDLWILARTQQVIQRVTENFNSYEYAAAKGEIEGFFWRDVADNYLEMVKRRLYTAEEAGHQAAIFTLDIVLQTLLKLLAPFLPYVTEVVYQELFAQREGIPSIHRARFPQVEAVYDNAPALAMGEILVDIATAVRRYKSEKNLGLGSEIIRLQSLEIAPDLAYKLDGVKTDLMSVTRARVVEVVQTLDPTCSVIKPCSEGFAVAIQNQ